MDKAYLKSILVEIHFNTDTVNIKSRLNGKKFKYCEKPDNISQFILDKTNEIFDVKNLDKVYEKLANFINNNK